MVKWTIDNGEIKGDKFITTRKMVRSIVSKMNARINKLSRLKAKFKHFNNYTLTYRNCDTYPIEAYEIVNGTKFFSIYCVEDFNYAN